MSDIITREVRKRRSHETVGDEGDSMLRLGHAVTKKGLGQEPPGAGEHCAEGGVAECPENILSSKLKLVWGEPRPWTSYSEEQRILRGATPEEWAKRKSNPDAGRMSGRLRQINEHARKFKAQHYGDMDCDTFLKAIAAEKEPEMWFTETPETIAADEARRAAVWAERKPCKPYYDPFIGLYGLDDGENVSVL